jgi:hypothetical protein
MKSNFVLLKIYWDNFLKVNHLNKDLLFNNFEKNHFNFLNNIFNKILNTDGSIVECGIGYGKSFLIFSELIKSNKVDKNLWGFDSFEGFPEPSDFDKSSRNPQKGEWGKSSLKLIKNLLKNIEENDSYLKNINIVKGFIDETLPKYKNNICSIALLHLDLDLYDSYKTALENLWEIVTKGGVVIFDEYRHPKWPGATMAIDQFFKNKGQVIIKDNQSNRHYLIKK